MAELAINQILLRDQGLLISCISVSTNTDELVKSTILKSHSHQWTKKYVIFKQFKLLRV